ncbi:MAG: hypothetical protein JST23_09160 [Bacteroidetes bacterium]|nr:hypothetical protein [Bacteroidota bacterium]
MIYLLTGTIRSGKTTALMQWCSQKKNVFGILTPDVKGERMFYNILTNEYFPMLAKPNEDALIIGKYNFSKAGFEKAINIILENSTKDNWLVIDEIGPLELKGEGFNSCLKQVLKNRSNKLIIVVREGLAESVCNSFGIKQASQKIISVEELKFLQI